MSRQEHVAQQQTTQVALTPPVRQPVAPQVTPAEGELLGLQRSIGNQAVLSLLHAQASLLVGPADDPYEREADAVARQVVANLDEVPEAPTADVALESDEDEGLARSILRRHGNDEHAGAPEIGWEGGALGGDLEHELQSARSGGAALPSGVRRKMEGAFGADFGGVRLHDGPQSADLNHKLGASAFTVGRDIFFGGATPSLSGSAGSSLLAHELTHVVQQGAAGSLA